MRIALAPRSYCESILTELGPCDLSYISYAKWSKGSTLPPSLKYLSWKNNEMIAESCSKLWVKVEMVFLGWITLYRMGGYWAIKSGLYLGGWCPLSGSCLEFSWSYVDPPNPWNLPMSKHLTWWPKTNSTHNFLRKYNVTSLLLQGYLLNTMNHISI